MSPLVWKVYAGGELTGSLRFAEDAAALVAVLGDGATVRVDGRIVWREGREENPAAESYDWAAGKMLERRRANSEARYAAAYRA